MTRSPRSPIWILLALLAVVALGATACGSDEDNADGSDDAADDAGDDAAGDDAAGDDAGDQGAGEGGSTGGGDATNAADDTASGVAGQDDGSAVDDGSAGGDESSGGGEPTPVARTPDVIAYCGVVAEQDLLSDAVDPFDPDAVQAWTSGNLAALDEILPEAPAEIAADLAVVREGLDEFVQILAANGWDLIGSSDQLDTIAEDPEFAAAQERVTQWEDINCEPESNSSGSFEDTFADPEALAGILESEAGREMIIAGMIADGTTTREQANCLLDALPIEVFAAAASGAAPTADQLEIYLQAIDSCGIALG